MRIIEGAESFLLEGKNNKAVLLLHGYTGAPSEMRPLGDYLHALGYTVSCVRLPGHGTSIKDLEATTATDWYAAAEAECLELLARFDSVYVAGLSGYQAGSKAAGEEGCFYFGTYFCAG